MKTNILQKNIPQNWIKKQFEDCVVVPAKLKGLKNSEYKNFGKYPIFDQAQEYISGYSDEEKLLNKNYPAILFGDHTRIIKYIKSPFIPGADGTKIFWAKDGIDSSFLYYSLLNLNIPNTGYNRHFKFLKDSKILIPNDIAEQKKIAEILSKVDEEINKTDELISKTGEIKRGVFREFLNQDNNTKDWKIRKIKELLDFEQPNNYIVENENYNNEFKIPVLTANKSFILGYTNETFGIYKNIPVIIFDDFTTDSKFVNFPFKIKSSAIKILKNKENVSDIKFVYEVMKSINFPIANHKRHYISQYQELEILTPSLSEQKRISKILEFIDKKLDKQKELKEKLIQLKKGLMSDLLSGKVRV